jgi:hypothetical protein
LTEDARTGPEDNGFNLYEYELASGHLTDLTVDGGDVGGAGVLGVAAISEEGAYVYFVAEGDLAGNARAGQANLYVSHDGGAPKFIATLANGEPGTEERIHPVFQADELDWTASPSRNMAVATPDGTRLAFQSLRSLTGYDNKSAGSGYVASRGDCLEEYNGETNLCSEVYVYDATTGSLACPSCNPTGARPIGKSQLHTFTESGEGIQHKTQNFSEDDRRLVFESYDALVPHDNNGQRDVYEYQDGHVYPLSDVAGKFESIFLDMSATGNDVFIGTADQLLPSDTDFRIDVYDARVGGGYPVTVSPPVCDNGDSCKGPPTLQPVLFGAPASETFSGAGNVTPTMAPAVTAKVKPKPTRCKKGYARKRNKCVRQRTTKSGGRDKKRGKK